MVVNTASHASRSGYEEENHLSIRATAEWKEQSNPSISRRRLPKWFGAFSTALICAAALAPNVFGIPSNLEAWVFLTSIFWFFAFCAGMFDF